MSDILETGSKLVKVKIEEKTFDFTCGVAERQGRVNSYICIRKSDNSWK